MTNDERKEFIRKNKIIYFNRIRYFFYEWTDMKAYQRMLVPETFFSFFYQLFVLMIAFCSVTIIIYNQIELKQANEEHIDFIAKYFEVYYAFNIFFIIDYLIRISYADYTYNSISRLKAFLIAPFRFVNLLDLVSFVAIVIIYNTGLLDFVAKMNETTSYSQKFDYYYQIINNNAYMNVVPCMFLIKILGAHSKIIKNVILSSEVNFFWQIFKRRWRVLLSSFLILVLFTFLLSFIIYRIEQNYYEINHILPGNPLYKLKNFGETLWFSMGTITTIAYGDVTPVSPAGKVFAVILGVIGVTYYGFLTSLFASALISVINEFGKRRDNRRLLEFQNENERLLHEFSEQIKVDIVQELIKNNIIQDPEEIKRIENLQNQEREALKMKAKRRKKIYFSDDLFDDTKRISVSNVKVRSASNVTKVLGRSSTKK